MAERYRRPASAEVHEVGPLARAGRWVFALSLVGAAVFGALQEARFRVLEATIAQQWMGGPLEGSVRRFEDLLYFPWVNGPAVGLQITSECTVILLIAPVVVVAAVLCALTRFQLLRVAGGLIAGVALLMIANQIRLLVIAFSVQTWGWAGYDVSHKFVGTVIGLVGFTLAVLLMLRVAAGSDRSRRRDRSLA
ncbi:exosortase/archaeosortase family protein [Nocardioides caeni]|uniref:Exosortase/archaeosortase family protein n=1 Tax=Nocardioides caeni TaxID=574700 RepID=A0A4S8N3E2_9ACTN|nr:exosortase/archaeosortase family protein [Nocardioides caeni]THV10520.1 hypothetical protein E9934_14450 [Nocardioides caeni]